MEDKKYTTANQEKIVVLEDKDYMIYELLNEIKELLIKKR